LRAFETADIIKMKKSKFSKYRCPQMGLSVVTVVEKNRNSFATDGINALRGRKNTALFLKGGFIDA